VLQDAELWKMCDCLDAEREFVSSVLTGVVENHDLLDVLPNLWCNPFQNLAEGCECVIGNDQDADTLTAVIGAVRCLLERVLPELRKRLEGQVSELRLRGW
jgi:hypothetical protein